MRCRVATLNFISITQPALRLTLLLFFEKITALLRYNYIPCNSKKIEFNEFNVY